MYVESRYISNYVHATCMVLSPNLLVTAVSRPGGLRSRLRWWTPLGVSKNFGEPGIIENRWDLGINDDKFTKTVDSPKAMNHHEPSTSHVF